jgi:membrane protein
VRLAAAPDAVREWYQDRAQRLGAALAFYTLFALAPGRVILIPLTGVFLGSQAAQGRIVDLIEFLIGRPGGAVATVRRRSTSSRRK